jgi:hypothetical protein
MSNTIRVPMSSLSPLKIDVAFKKSILGGLLDMNPPYSITH